MDIEFIRKSVKNIKDMAGDDESAHSMENNLYIDAIDYVALGGELTQEMAREILKTKEIDFSRWCA